MYHVLFWEKNLPLPAFIVGLQVDNTRKMCATYLSLHIPLTKLTVPAVVNMFTCVININIYNRNSKENPNNVPTSTCMYSEPCGPHMLTHIELEVFCKRLK